MSNAASSSLAPETLVASTALIGSVREHVFLREDHVCIHSADAAGPNEKSSSEPDVRGRTHRAFTATFTLIRTRPGAVLSALFLSFLLIAAIQPEWLTAYDALGANAREAFRAPNDLHWFGTDENGRDVLARIIYGVRPSILIGLAATALGVTIGATVGLTAGLSHKAVDFSLMRVIDMLMSLPVLLLALVIITFWGQGTFNAIIAISLASVPRYARIVRAQVHTVRQAGYVEAATTLGLHRFTIIIRHILPNAIKPVLILAVIGIGEKIAFGAALSFLGLGAPPPAPEWGSMLSVGRNFLANAPWLTAVPGLVITLTVLSAATLGRELLRHSEGKVTP